MYQQEDYSPKGGRHEAVCQQGRWSRRGVDLVGIPHQLEKGTSASEDIGPWTGVDCISHIGWGEDKTPSIKVWKPLSSRRVLKTLEGKPERESQKRTISASGGLGPLQWYQSQRSDDVPARRLFPEGGDTRRCATKDAEPLKEVDWVGVPHRLEKGSSASNDASPWKRWIVISHTSWGGELNTLYKSMETSLY